LDREAAASVIDAVASASVLLTVSSICDDSAWDGETEISVAAGDAAPGAGGGFSGAAFSSLCAAPAVVAELSDVPMLTRCVGVFSATASDELPARPSRH
jgi:hypothetical protein